MKYSCFEELPVWQAAIELKLTLDDLCRDKWARRLRNWLDQIDRASLSISNNIAEGFERGTTNELLYFLYVARGSSGETRSLLRYLDRRLERAQANSAARDNRDAENSNFNSQTSDLKSQISDFKSEISNLKSEIARLRQRVGPLIAQAESVSRQLRGWADALQNGEITGQGHLTDESQRTYQNRRESNAFWQHIRSQHRARWDKPAAADENQSRDPTDAPS